MSRNYEEKVRESFVDQHVCLLGCFWNSMFRKHIHRVRNKTPIANMKKKFEKVWLFDLFVCSIAGLVAIALQHLCIYVMCVKSQVVVPPLSYSLHHHILLIVYRKFFHSCSHCKTWLACVANSSRCSACGMMLRRSMVTIPIPSLVDGDDRW